MPQPETSILRELASFAEAVAAKARPVADDVEVYVLRRDLVTFAIENRSLAPELKLGRLQVGLRALKGGRLAVAATTSFNVDENVSALKAGLAAARETPLARFGAHRTAPLTDAFDEGIARFSREPRMLQQLAVDVRDRAFAAAAEAAHVETVEGRVSASTRWIAIATAEGSGAWLENAISVHAEVNSARSESEVLRAWPDDDAYVRDVGARAVRSYPARRISPRDLGLGAAARVAALLDPHIVEALLRYPAHDHFLASSLASQQTSLAPGAPIADERLRLVDTGTQRPLLLAFDDELTPRGETVLVEKGRFASFVSSRASAKRTGLPETGNGFRHPILAEDTSEAPVRDRLAGLAMDAGERESAAILREQGLAIVPRAILGIHGADRARTAFSATVADGVAVKDGEIIGHLAPGEWNVAARVLPGDGEPGLLQQAEPSADRVYTGSAVLPHLLVTIGVG